MPPHLLTTPRRAAARLSSARCPRSRLISHRRQLNQNKIHEAEAHQGSASTRDDLFISAVLDYLLTPLLAAAAATGRRGIHQATLQRLPDLALLPRCSHTNYCKQLLVHSKNNAETTDYIMHVTYSLHIIAYIYE